VLGHADNRRKTLVVGNTLAIAVGMTGEGRLEDALNFLQVRGHILLGTPLARDNKVPGLIDAMLPAGELSAVLGNLPSD